eukprot:1959044-Prorocentrum_lima.AAC.1
MPERITSLGQGLPHLPGWLSSVSHCFFCLLRWVVCPSGVGVSAVVGVREDPVALVWARPGPPRIVL